MGKTKDEVMDELWEKISEKLKSLLEEDDFEVVDSQFNHYCRFIVLIEGFKFEVMLRDDNKGVVIDGPIGHRFSVGFEEEDFFGRLMSNVKLRQEKIKEAILEEEKSKPSKIILSEDEAPIPSNTQPGKIIIP